MDASKKNFALGHNYGPPSNYRVTWNDGTTQDVKVHSIDFPNNRNFEAYHRFESESSRHVRLFAAIDGHWTLVLSAAEYKFAKIEFIDRDPEPEPDVDDSEEGPDPRDNGEVPANEIQQSPEDRAAQPLVLDDLAPAGNSIPTGDITRDAILATPIDSLLDSGVVRDTWVDGLLDRRAIHHETYGF